MIVVWPRHWLLMVWTMRWAMLLSSADVGSSKMAIGLRAVGAYARPIVGVDHPIVLSRGCQWRAIYY